MANLTTLYEANQAVHQFVEEQTGEPIMLGTLAGRRYCFVHTDVTCDDDGVVTFKHYIAPAPDDGDGQHD